MEEELNELFFCDNDDDDDTLSGQPEAAIEGLWWLEFSDRVGAKNGERMTIETGSPPILFSRGSIAINR